MPLVGFLFKQGILPREGHQCPSILELIADVEGPHLAGSVPGVDKLGLPFAWSFGPGCRHDRAQLLAKYN
jgi:hypothetical protein